MDNLTIPLLPVSQDEINSILWNACDTFRGTIDASRDFGDVKTQNNLREQDIKKIVAAYQKPESVDKYAYLASFDEIKENDFNLNIPRYVDTFEEEEEIDIEEVQSEIDLLEDELQGIKIKMSAYLQELGFEI